MLQRVQDLLEYNKVKEQLKRHVASSLGKERVDRLTPSTTLDDVQTLQDATDEGATVLRLKGNMPLGGIFNIRASVRRAEIGGMLYPDNLMEIGSTIYGSRQVKAFIDDLEEDEATIPMIRAYCDRMEPEVELEKAIKRCIDDDGHVLDSASDTLRGIRQQLRSYESRIREKLEGIVRSSKYQKMLSDAIITIRNDRYVIPVKQEYRTAFGGMVHDQSSSGQTLFIEPQSVVSINNSLKEAKVKEEREIERILQALSEHVAESAEPLIEITDILAELDFIFTKAHYAKSLKASKPELNDEGIIDFKQARHPLIDAEDVVPIDAEIGQSFDSLIITGPNTGGKTVTLKTIGLLTLMAQSGLQIPVKEGSTAAIFESVFADIGDEQSIEQSLSTFSSHMTNIVSILEELDHRSLVLFDELGAGTDPQEGAALAISILDESMQRGAKVVATTHYSELKAYAYNRSNVMNASVEFDVETLRPTYRLLLGVPGRSNAFDISRRLGLNEQIIEEARSHISSDTNKVDRMIASLEDSQKQAEQELKEAETIRAEAEQVKKDLEVYYNKIETEKDNLLQDAKKEARSIVEKAKQESEQVLEELHELQKEGYVKGHKVIDAKKRLDDATPKQDKHDKQKQKQTKKIESFQPGDEVKVISFNQKGQIVEKANDKEYLVQLGIMKMTVKATDLERLEQKEEQTPKQRFVGVKGKKVPVKMELDLRGKRYEDAKVELERYLDDALLANYGSVSIIHGKGTGALRKGVEKWLKGHRHVKNVRMGGMGEGGSGVTVVELK